MHTEQTAVKKFNRTARDIAINMIRKGTSYEETGRYLTAQGWVTPRGKPLTVANLARILRKKYKFTTRKRGVYGMKRITATALMDNHNQVVEYKNITSKDGTAERLELVVPIMAANIPDEKKLELVRAVVK